MQGTISILTVASLQQFPFSAENDVFLLFFSFILQGNGTRKGNGSCACDVGYTGPMCNSCADGYYQAYKDEKVILCSPCHVSCQGACTQAGVKGNCER